jgi:hypothetical protein
MDKKSKILLAVFFALIIISVGITYYRTIVKRDYIVEAQTDCDPYTEACFVWQCDPGSTEEGVACTGDPETDVWYYKIAKRNAENIPECDPEADETCDPWTCVEGEKDCSEILCDEATAEEQGVSCNDPEEYTLNNPPEEETEEGLSEDEAGCDPELDEECVIEEDSSASETQCEEGDESCAAEESGTECGPEDDTCADEATDVVETDSGEDTPNLKGE